MLLVVLLCCIQKFMLVCSSRSSWGWYQCFPTGANWWGTTAEEQQILCSEKKYTFVFQKLLGEYTTPRPSHHEKPGDMLFNSITFISTYGLVIILQIEDTSSNFIYFQNCIFSCNIFSFMCSFVIHSAFSILQKLFHQEVSP